MPLNLSHIPIVDHHAHALLRGQPATPADWLGFFTESADPVQVAEHVPHTLFFRYAVKALAGLFGCEPRPAAILAERDRMGLAAWTAWLVRDARIAVMLLDYGFRGPQNFGHEEMRGLLPCRVEPMLRLEVLAQELILAQETWDQALDAFSTEVEGARSAGYVALKSIIAYRTGLAVREWSRDEVLAAYGPVKEAARRAGSIRLASAPLTDSLLLRALEIAERQVMPVQFHTGFGDSDVDLRTANPLHFRPLLQSGRFSHVPWIMLHMSYPYVREAAYLASIYPNVYVDLSLAVPFALREAPLLITQLLGLAPTSKLMYASDGFSVPELFWLGARAGRTALARALEAAIADQALTPDEAESAAEAILSGNATRVYAL